MKHSILALPALLRPALYLASASQHSFSVNDDLLAFPQYEVRFLDDWVSEDDAQSRLKSPKQPQVQQEDNAADVAHYQGQTPSDTPKKEQQLTYERLTLDSQPYLCSIPTVDPPSNQDNANNTVSKQEHDKELARANDRGWELLSGMHGTCVYFISGWWSYKFCYDESVRQFHQLPPSRGVPAYPPVEDPNVKGFTLGSAKTSKDKEGKKDVGKSAENGVAVGEKIAVPKGGELVQRGESTYLVQRMEGGTVCDLTRKERRVEIQFHCNPTSADRISLIKETSTCAYLLVIQTPRLCKDVAFLPPQKDEPNPINCSPILASDQVADWEEDMAALRSAEEDLRIWEADPEAAKIFLSSDAGEDPSPAQPVQIQVAGDVVVGARAIVPEGVTIEKGAIVGGGKETYVDTIASSEGRELSQSEMEELGLKDAKSLERLKKQLEKMAKGESWKLDVIDTPRGREYRGIIGKDEKEGEEGVEGKEGEGESESGGEGEESGQGEQGSEEEFYREEL